MVQGFDVTLLLTRKGGTYENALSEKIEKVYLTNVKRSYMLSLLLSIFNLNGFLKNYSGFPIVAIQDGPIVLALLVNKIFRRKVKIIGWVQNNPNYLLVSVSGRVIYYLAKKLYNQLRLIISLSSGVLNEYKKLMNLVTQNSVVIPNISYLENINMNDSKMVEGKGTKIVNLVACGRLEKQKNYPIMLDIFAEVKKSFPKCKLHIIGNGSQKGILKNLAEKLNINDHINWYGFIKDPAEIMQKTDILLLTSTYEGFGNVIVEAMSLGLPVIAMDCPHGPAEIIIDGVNGILVENGNKHEFESVLIELIGNPSKRQRIGINAHKSAQRYSAEKVASEFLSAYQEI